MIAGILIDNRDAANYFSVFYLRRCFRILPLYYAFLLGFSFLVFLRVTGFAELPLWLFVFSYPAWTYFTFTQNFFMAWFNDIGYQSLAVTWSLAVEEQFYLTFPLLVWLFPRKVLWLAFLGLVFLSIFTQLMLFTYLPNQTSALRFLMPTSMDAFGLGALVALSIRSERGHGFY